MAREPCRRPGLDPVLRRLIVHSVPLKRLERIGDFKRRSPAEEPNRVAGPK